MARTPLPYDRRAAVAYAHAWAYRRNPFYYDYNEIGGDCTNFASQCLYAGAGVMNFTPDYGWYYIDANQKAPAWTGVDYFYRYLIRNDQSAGPFAQEAVLAQMQPGDFVQLRAFNAPAFTHTAVVVRVGRRPNLSNVLVAAHSSDTDYKPLRTYSFSAIRFLHILGVYPQEDAQEDF